MFYALISAYNHINNRQFFILLFNRLFYHQIHHRKFWVSVILCFINVPAAFSLQAHRIINISNSDNLQRYPSHLTKTSQHRDTLQCSSYFQCIKRIERVILSNNWRRVRSKASSGDVSFTNTKKKLQIIILLFAKNVNLQCIISKITSIRNNALINERSQNKPELEWIILL